MLMLSATHTLCHIFLRRYYYAADEDAKSAMMMARMIWRCFPLIKMPRGRAAILLMPLPCHFLLFSFLHIISDECRDFDMRC